MNRTWAIVATVAGLLLAGDARAANPVPGNAGGFISYCANHFADCKAKVVEADIAVLATKLFAKQGESLCTIPKGVSTDTATKEILTWLGGRNIAPSMRTDDAIQAAVKDLWKCKVQIGDGSEPGGPPAKTGAFVAYCPGQEVKCANKMVAVTVAIMVPDKPIHCVPPNNIKGKELGTTVLAWLRQHRETHEMRTEDGIATAFDHLWPCRR
jgi:hypothetical protein